MVDSNYLSILPRQAFRYWPTGDYVKIGQEKSTVRFIFYKIEFTEFEVQQLDKYKIHISKHSSLPLPTFFTDPEMLRILLGCKFDFKKAYDALLSSIEWRSQHLQNSYFSLYPLCENLLNSGTIYFHGRDHRFRPLLIINIERFDFSKNSSDPYSTLLCFLLEFAIKKLMMPGQIENWIVITDLCNKGLTKLPISDMQKVIKTLQDNFRCRMSVNYVVNSPGSINFIWRIAKRFIEEHTIKKIRIEKSSSPSELFSHFNRNQLERKYGGTAPNLTQFWPPTFPEGSLNADGVSIDSSLTENDTYFDYFPQEKEELHKDSSYSEVSSCMGSISEKIKLDMPDSFIEENIKKVIRIEEQGELRESDYNSLRTVEMELEPNEGEIITPCMLSEMSHYSLEPEQVSYDESHLGPANIDGTHMRVPRNSDELNARPVPDTKSSRLCKMCSVRKCVIY